MKVKVTGNLDGLKTITNNAEKLNENGSVSLADILSDEFIQSNTDFKSLNDLFEKAGFKVETKEDLEAVPQEELDQFICDNTNFEGFTDLQTKALSEYVRKQLLNGLK